MHSVAQVDAAANKEEAGQRGHILENGITLSFKTAVGIDDHLGAERVDVVPLAGLVHNVVAAGVVVGQVVVADAELQDTIVVEIGAVDIVNRLAANGNRYKSLSRSVCCHHR